MNHIRRFAKIAFAIGKPVNLGTSMVLDFGCGSAAVVVDERAKGCNICGCDLASGLATAPKDLIEKGVLRTIDVSKYRIPFDDAIFDLVVSHQVLEHVLNYNEVLREIRRVLKPDGISIHKFPSKYTPIEPHVYVPLATTVRSMHWLRLWAYCGVRNEYQRNLTWTKVADINYRYLLANTNYLTKSELVHRMRAHFSSVEFAEKQFLAAGNRYGPALAKVPLVPQLFGAFVERVVVCS